MELMKFSDRDGKIFKKVKYFEDKNRFEETIKSEEKIGETINFPHFEDVIYPVDVKEAMRLILSHLKHEDFNLLFGGVRGCGKTFSARMLACETQRPFIYMSGNMSKNKIIDILLNIKPKSIILIDEIHGLRDSVAEIIYPAIQDNEIYVNGERKKLDCMFIGTTTEVQKLPAPLFDRFFLIEFEELEEEQLKDILLKKGCDLPSANAMLSFTNNFRVLNNLVKMINLYGKINIENTKKVFKIKRIDINLGLSEIQKKYLEVLKDGKLSLRSLSLQLNRSEDYVKSIETDLIKKKLVNVSSRGRLLTPKFADYGYDELKKAEEKEHSEKTIDEVELAHRYLKEHPEIKKKFGNRYMELVQWIAAKIGEGINPDEIDIYSFGNDKNIEDSFQENYLEDL